MAASFQAQKHKSGHGQSQEEWTVREKLALASSVQRSGDQNWVSVSRAIKPINETGCLGKVRPPDFFSQKNCAILYSQMLEKVNTPKRKRTNDTGAGETPGEQIIRKLTFERIEELKKSIKNDQMTYRKLKMRIEDIRNGKVDSQLPAVWEEIQARKRRFEELQQMQQSGSLPTSGGDGSAIPFPSPTGVNFPVSAGAMLGLKQGTQATPSPHKGKQLRIPKPTPRFQKYQQQLQQRHGQGGQHGQPTGSPGDVGMPGDSPRSSTDAPRLSLDAEPLKTEPMDIDPGTAVQTVTIDVPAATAPEVFVPEVTVPKTEPSVTSPASTARRPSSGNVIPQADSLKTLLTQPVKEQHTAAQLDLAKKGIDTQSLSSGASQDSHTTPPAPSIQPSTKISDVKPFLGHRSTPETHKLDSIRERVSSIPGSACVTAPTLSKLLSTSTASPNSTIVVNSASSNSFIDKSIPNRTIENTVSPGLPGQGRGAISVGK
ncbi:bromodomain-containing protein 8 [Exaiptasia diaphana]|uniref:Uncharacterized protein n=1 Tax=Exaiptasia diaphana TaxID=2652724 RepID=A0A913XN66_EXADI|nr:bromodomain-containing protein 8 [Exaiptasia diaphana]KXJ25371.1 Bromodomain-containing protein 8 [Exaiptasia diaphana]